MPIYEFICESCGPFERRRPFAEAGDPMACPACRSEAGRVYSVPNTRKMPTALSGAINRAEKSAHEPDVVRRPSESTASRGGQRQGHGRPWTLGH